MATEAPTGAQVGEAARAEAEEGMAAPIASPEAEEEALEVVTALGAAESYARETAGREDTATPRAKAMEATGDTRAEAPSELAAPAPRRAAVRAPTSLS